ncbi:MAG: hypothetical protein R2813_03515 [Flavobacteriales bacterium]
MSIRDKISSQRIQQVSTIALLSLALFQLLTVLVRFNFVYTDIDQCLMWYGTSEFRQLHFHMPRFFGQNYGSMLEALVAAPMIFFPINVAVPFASSLLFLLPFIFLISFGNSNSDKLALVAFLLCVLPVEYLMMANMPRDFVSGLAVTSLAIPLLLSPKRWAKITVGFLCILGWSFNHNAALLGAMLSAFAAFNENGAPNWRWALYLGLGYFFGFGAHFLISSFGYLHPEFIVHHAWNFHYAWKQVLQGWTNLDRHFRWLTPIFHGQGTFYLLLMISFPVYFYAKRQFKLVMTSLAGLVVTFASFGILKVHDGYDSIFLSHERMFLALPVMLAFLLTQMRLKKSWILPVLAILSACFVIRTQVSLSETIAAHVDPARKDNKNFLHITHQQVKDDCDMLRQAVNSNQSQAVIIYPTKRIDGLQAYACSSIDKDIIYVDAGYDRKTWDMRALDQPAYTSVILVSDHPHLDSLVSHLSMDVHLQPTNESSIYALTGEPFNPLDVMRELKFTVSNH